VLEEVVATVVVIRVVVVVGLIEVKVEVIGNVVVLVKPGVGVEVVLVKEVVTKEVAVEVVVVVVETKIMQKIKIMHLQKNFISVMPCINEKIILFRENFFIARHYILYILKKN
jgi:hypothetical protein